MRVLTNILVVIGFCRICLFPMTAFASTSFSFDDLHFRTFGGSESAGQLPYLVYVLSDSQTHQDRLIGTYMISVVERGAERRSWNRTDPGAIAEGGVSIATPSVAPEAKTAPPSPSAYYLEALHATRAAPQPAAASFDEQLRSSGMKFALVPDKDVARLAIGYGRDMRNALDIQASYASQTGVQVTQDGATHHVSAPIFNPTWSGIEDWMRYGFDGPPAGSAHVAVTAAPTATPDTLAPPTIAVVAAVDPGAYSITDGGAATCEDRRPGRRLLLHALSKPDIHPLTSVVIDESTKRFCTMSFRLGASSALSLTGAFELHLGAVGEYWLITDGTADFQVRLLGISAQHSRIAFSYGDFTFPSPAAL